MDAIAVYRSNIEWGHQLLELVMADVTPELAHWHPPGVANPIGATYAHAVFAEDGVVQVFCRGVQPMFLTEWAGRTGANHPSWPQSLEWGRSLQLDLAAFGQYAQAVFAATFGYLDSITVDELRKETDMSSAGLGVQPIAAALNIGVVSHLHNMAGEISALKGVYGTKGYPF